MNDVYLQVYQMLKIGEQVIKEYSAANAILNSIMSSLRLVPDNTGGHHRYCQRIPFLKIRTCWSKKKRSPFSLNLKPLNSRHLGAPQGFRPVVLVSVLVHQVVCPC